MRPRLTVLIVALAVAAAAAATAQGRLRPPAFVACDRNALTSFTGVVTAIERAPGTTTIAMNTDEDTRERFVLRHAGSAVERVFFLRGQPFTPADWPAIVSGGKVRAGVRATVWACAGAPNPQVDWTPPADGVR